MLCGFRRSSSPGSYCQTLQLDRASIVVSLRSGPSGRASKGASVRTRRGTLACSRPCEGLAVSKASVQLRNGADELDAPRAPSSRQEYGPTRRDWGDRYQERFRSRSWCLRRSDSATMERIPPGPSRRARVARKWMKRTTRWRRRRMVADGES